MRGIMESAPSAVVPLGSHTRPNRGSILGDDELAVIEELLRSGSPLSGGVWRERFEEAFRAHLGVAHALSVTSGTTALRLALHLLDLRPGDEVIATPQTYLATVQPLLDYGVRVRFCDVEPDSLNIDAERIEELITERTRAVVMVHYGGRAADMPRIMALAERYGLTVVEDAAHAIGGSLHGRPLGSFGHFGIFSFHSSKNITTLGEGGMLVVQDDEAAARATALRDNEVDAVYVPSRHTFASTRRPPAGAMFPAGSYTADCLMLRGTGINGTLAEPAAAVGFVQLGRLPALQARRRELARQYTERLADIPGLYVPPVPEGVDHPYHLFTAFVDPELIDRDGLLNAMDAAGAQLSLRYFPLHLMPEWRAHGHREGECPVAERRWFREMINIPCQPGIDDDQAAQLMDQLERTISRSWRRGRTPLGRTA